MSSLKRKSDISRRIKDIKLNSLLEVTKAINNNFSTESLLEIYTTILKDQLSIGKLALYSNERSWNCILKYGIGDDLNKIDVKRDLLTIKEIGTINIGPSSDHRSFEIVIPVFHKSEPLAYVLLGDLEDTLEMSPAIKHLPFIQTLTNVIVVAIENKKLAKESIRQAALKRELELASEMQNMLFPTLLPNNNSLETSALYLPHQQVGGDYYDFLELNANEVVMCMADVSGKGVAAALLMSNFQANMHALILHIHSLKDLVVELNKRVMASAKGEKFITMFICKYNIKTKKMEYVNAGHNPPVLIHDGDVLLLEKGCTGLGMFDDVTEVNKGIIHVNDNSVMVCYTDGVVEVENGLGKDFGLHNLSQTIVENSDKKMSELNSAIINAIDQYKGSMPYVDDITLLSCRFR